MTALTNQWAVALEHRVLAGKYRLIRLLGAGGMGAVFEAEQPALGRRVAIKLVLPRKQASEQALQRFALEARAASRVAVGGVPHVFDFDYDAELGPFQVLELLEGESLQARLTRGPLTPAGAYAVVLEALEVLGRVHAAGVVHRDIKPGNVFLEQRADGARRVCVLDFGVARVRDPLAAARVTAAGAVLGTLGYMPPESLAGRDVDHRADLYSMGVVLWSCLTGREPFDRVPDAQALAAAYAGRVPSLRTARPDLSERLQRAYEWATAAEPDARPASADALATELRRAQLDEVPAVLAGAVPIPSQRPASRAVAALPAPGTTMVSGAAPAVAPAPSDRAPPPHASAPPVAPARGPVWMPIALALALGALVAMGTALVLVLRAGSRPSSVAAAPDAGSRAALPTTAPAADAAVAPSAVAAPPAGPDRVLDGARAALANARALAAQHRDDDALAAAELARRALDDAPAAAVARVAALADVQLAIGDIDTARLPGLAARLTTRGPGECVMALARPSDAAANAYTMLVSDGRFTAEAQQCANQRLGLLYETMDRVCTGDPSTHGGYTRIILMYYRRADRPGPCRAQATAGLARAVALDRALPP